MNRRLAAQIVACSISLVLASLSAVGAAELREKIDSLAKPLVVDGTAVGFVVGVLDEGQTHFFRYGETLKGSGTLPGRVSQLRHELADSWDNFQGELAVA